MQTTTKQKAMRFLFWAVLFYTAITATIVIGIQFHLIPVPTQAASKEVTPLQKDTLNMSELTFAKQFAREYFSWSLGAEEQRAERLKPYWANQLDVQGGMDFSQLKWNSYVQNAEVWKVSDRPGGEGIKEITVFVETLMVDSKNSNLQKRVDRYVTIPIKAAGESYRVIDKPTFLAPPVGSSLELSKSDEEKKGEWVSDDVKKKLDTFLHSFWKVYTSASPDEIRRYLTGNRQELKGLTGVMKFLELENFEARKEGDQYLVGCDLLMQDLASGAQFQTHYQLTLIEKNGSWFVTKMKSGEENQE